MKQEFRLFPLPSQVHPLQIRLRLWFPEEQTKKLCKFLKKNPSKKTSIISDMIRACMVGRSNQMFVTEKGKIDRCWVGEQYRLIGTTINNKCDFLVLDQWEKKQTELRQMQKHLFGLYDRLDFILNNYYLSDEPYWRI